MREIKFRAWDKHKKKMIDNANVRRIPLGYLEDETCTGGAYADELYEFMQYTGLKDKNGKEIYENDLIMQYDYKGDRWEIRQIIYSDHSLNLGWCMKGIKKINKYNISELCTVGIGPRDTERCEVIGNIFDNSELLERGAE